VHLQVNSLIVVINKEQEIISKKMILAEVDQLISF
jgi:hypothetical protein